MFQIVLLVIIKISKLGSQFINLQFIDVGNMVSPTVHARRSLSYLLSDMPQEALNDALQAQAIFPIWHIASYLQAAALLTMGKENEAKAALKEASTLENKRNTNA
jgi:BR-signaling kinase